MARSVSLRKLRSLRPVVWPVLASFVLQPIVAVLPVAAAVRIEDRDGAGSATALAPAAGERLAASAVRFAAELPGDLGSAQVVVSRVPFDPTTWKAIPEGEGLARADISTGLATLDATGISVESPGELWWSVVTTSATTGRLRTTPVRSFTALPRFTNRVRTSPYLIASRSGLLGAGERPRSAPPRIRLASGYDFAPLTDGAPTVPLGLSSTNAQVAPADGGEAGGTRSYLVQFSQSPGDDDRSAIARAGGVVFAYVPDHAFLVRMDAAAKDRLESSGRAAWIGDYQPAYKMSPSLSNPDIQVTGQYMALVFPDADARAVAAELGAAGFTVEATNDNGVNKLIRFRAPAGGLDAAARLSSVAWVEPVAVKTVDNTNAQWVVQTNLNGNRRVWDQGLRGLNQVVMTSDSGINTLHVMFADALVPLTTFGDYPLHRKIIAYQKGSTSPAVAFGDHGGANSYHGSHTACTMVGNDSINSSALTWDGMAKDAKIYFMDLSGSTLANSVVPFDDLNDLFLPPYNGNAGGAARISSNSWGSNVSGAYDLNSMQVDQFMWNHPDFYIGFSNGNAGASGSVGSPATAKNCSGMGGTQNGTLANNIYTSTSRGPTQDGRRKPTFCSPGQSVQSASGPGTTATATLSGTSMASPTGTGAVTLIRQYLTEGWYPTGARTASNSFVPSAALLKAMAINSGENLTGYTAPDNNIGWGRINADNVLYFSGDARKLLLVDNTDGLGQGQYIEYQVNVTDNSIPLKVDLCWTDYPGSPTALVQLVNNLDLTLTNGVSTYKGNVFAGGFSTTGGSADVVNVEEGCLVNAPSTGLWTIRVAAPTVPIGPQPFGLVVTGGVGQTAGTISLDRGEYGSTSTVEVQVVDTNAPGTIQVALASPSDPGETLDITGTNGVYHGTFTLTPYNSNNVINDGVVQVSDGDVITVTYQDASPAATLASMASVSFDTPMITYVKAVSQGASGTLVTFNTNLNAQGKVFYGLTPALELGSVNEMGARLSHQVVLTGLTPGATYYYDVACTALNGNYVRDDLGGTHYKFTAKNSADILLVVGEPGFPRLSAWQNALTADKYDYDTWIGPLASAPVLGDVNSGLRSYKAVVWQVGLDQYPPFDATQRTVVTDYLDGGGRLATVGHDIAWALGDLTSGFSDPSTQAWLSGTLHVMFQADPTTWSVNTGYASDPISGGYVGGVPYVPVRDGGAGDEVDAVAGGNVAYTWKNNDASPDDIGFRWESAVPNGTPGTAVWAGQPSRLANNFFEITAVDPPYTSSSAIRNDIVDKTIVWLLGRNRPTVTVTAPNGGEVLTGDNVNVTWNETVAGGNSIAARSIEYSLDAGDSWTLLTAAAGPGPYLWDITSVPNSSRVLVRIRVTDDGSPSLGQSDVSNAVFTIDRVGGDLDGPVVVAGSIASNPNPIVRPNAASLSATVSDAARGGSAIAAAEWSIGTTPAAAGTGTPLSLGGSGVTVGVNGSLDTTPFLPGARTLWVRGQDADGNWGPASALSIQVNGPYPVGVPQIPSIAFLGQNQPNPFRVGTTMRYGVPKDMRVDLGVYTVQGRLVKKLVNGDVPAGEYTAAWDGRDESGRRVASGVYYYAMVTPQGSYQKRMISLP